MTNWHKKITETTEALKKLKFDEQGRLLVKPGGGGA